MIGLSKLLQERIEKANQRRKLTAEEAKRLAKLDAIANKLKRGENVQNLQLYLTKIFLNQLLLITYCKMAITHSYLNLFMTKY